MRRKKSIRPNLQISRLTLIFQGILFGLCQFHAVMVERKKFGPKGFNLQYPFSVGDLVNSSSVLRNYMESAPAKVPWQDLRYLFGTLLLLFTFYFAFMITLYLFIDIFFPFFVLSSNALLRLTLTHLFLFTYVLIFYSYYFPPYR